MKWARVFVLGTFFHDSLLLVNKYTSLNIEWGIKSATQLSASIIMTSLENLARTKRAILWQRQRKIFLKLWYRSTVELDKAGALVQLDHVLQAEEVAVIDPDGDL
jgi:hypothetical protein